MKASHCSYFSSSLVPAFLLLLLPPALSGPMAVLFLAAEPAPGPGPPNPGPRTLPPLPPGSTAAQQPGRAPAEAMGPQGAQDGNSSTQQVSLVTKDHEEKASEGGAVGGGLAVSPNPSDKPMTQRALTVLMVVSGAVLVYFVVRTVR
ncbi:PREDICTED: membrane protein FAM174A-like [Chrysochloris asiatica]|uniref:Transmembrane protein 157 n=1 Tax=Chrysochloris asiatica TaxID=185453 RepID=A0A9B0UBN9_CHRAS|nr:PREDICTED: membrane protein FAM174A-like [Chrysochloris asiatica]